MNTQIIDAGRDANGGYKVDVSRGTNVDRVSSEWTCHGLMPLL
jgi:hypothetical protein